MEEAEGNYWITKFRFKLIVIYFLKITLLSLAIGILLTSMATFVAVNSVMIFAVTFMTVFCGMLIFKPTWGVTKLEVANYLNVAYPELEESAGLLLKPLQDLSLLERFQRDKINGAFPLPNSLKKASKGIWVNLILLIGVLIVHQFLPLNTLVSQPPAALTNLNAVKEQLLPGIKDFNVQILPPAYTGKKTRTQNQFTLKAEIGAQVVWRIETTVAVKKLRLIFNDREIITLNEDGRFSRVINQAGFYQIELDGKKSDLYPIEIIPDLPVSIKIIAPTPYTTIDVGQVPKVNLAALLKDDYGISDAYISATLSSGKGEGVSFTEKKLSFNTDVNNKMAVRLTKILDLTALGMKPGDELYFFIMAKDNHGQHSRSDVYMVTIVDTTELMSMAGMAKGIDLVPAYFRSQRQIIIDTEKLLKEQGTLALEEFKNRSNSLGMDQKLLRLRYGKFLGEESETAIGGEHDHEEGEEHTTAAFGDVKALMDEYAHKHDIAEDATFFEPELKKQLKAVLNEMWSSELRLRTYKPQEALPYEYKALRLLKDLQQKSRAYVAKTTLKTTKLKMEKRLSGELTKIVQPTQHATFEHTDRSIEELKILLSILEYRKTGRAFNYGDRELLRAGEKQLIIAASTHPTSYLAALKAIRKISLANNVNVADIDIVQSTIQKLLGKEISKPQAPVASPEVNLYRSYFNHLQNANQ
ncbi:DUF4175 family protein [Pedobacter insulae]|uniref:DUF4175 family protein n=1 Tax=Pedobacter insulae TaxID=414048 RepID=A0A1I2Y0Q1_9SPHI|nr:DUF4175 family protein [Pedobacter insulae]SFH19233.1 hypothetical protein SAMN04489864_106155 [Pedobacter insulae]